MVNRDKLKQQRFYALWKDGGSLEGMAQAEQRKKYAPEENLQSYLEARKDARDKLTRNGNLSHEEIGEYLKYEFDRNYTPLKIGLSLNSQIRRQFLKMKERNPVRAQEFLGEIRPLMKKEVTSDTIKDICSTLGKYVSGTFLRYQGQCYDIP